MDRRNFIATALRAAAGFAILPAATTYARRWAPTTRWTPGAIDSWFRRENLWVPTPAETWDNGVFSFVLDPLTGLTFQQHCYTSSEGSKNTSIRIIDGTAT